VPHPSTRLAILAALQSNARAIAQFHSGRHFLWLVLLFATLAARAADTPAFSKAEQTVRSLERSWLDAYEQLDTLAMDRIVAEDFLITFPDGSRQTKPQILADLRAQRSRPVPYTTRFHTEAVSSRSYGTTVVLTGVVVTTSQRDGKPVEDRSRYTDTYVEHDGRWQVVASHLSNAGAEPATQGSAPDAKRFVRDHTLVSHELPRMSMAVDPRLEYVGSIEFDLKQAAHVQRYLFASRDDQGSPARLLIVQFESMLPGAKGGYTFGLENPTRLGTHDYQTTTGLFNFDEVAAARPGAEAERTKAFLAQKSWKVEGEDFLVARYARIVDTEKRSEVIVFYYENLRTLGLSRRDLGPGGSRANELDRLLRDVAARARLSFTIRDAAG
jgi:ketosteroid isomerase-like protein